MSAVVSKSRRPFAKVVKQLTPFSATTKLAGCQREPAHRTVRRFVRGSSSLKYKRGGFNRDDTAGVDLDVINRYRWPTFVRYWDRCVLEDHDGVSPSVRAPRHGP